MNPGIGRMLAHEREQDLSRRVRAEVPARLLAEETGGPARSRRRSHPVRRLGTWSGLIMVRAGQRLAGIEVLAPRPPHIRRPA